jgi:sugar phosphate isomerase/epimerase
MDETPANTRSYVPAAFSTLGCPEASLNEVINLALEHELNGLELRIHDHGIISENMPTSDRKHVRNALSQAGLQVISLGSYIKVCDPDDEEIHDKLMRTLDLASDVGAKAIRVFPGAGTGAPVDESTRAGLEELGAARLARVLKIAEQAGVCLLLETHDSHPRGADIARILERVPDSRALGAIWDVLHPWRHGEDPAETLRQLGKKLNYVQLKDAALDERNGGLALTLLGEGHIPLQQILRLVKDATLSSGDKWISLEWEKAWHPELPEISMALPSFMATLNSSNARAGHGGIRRPAVD